MMSTVMDDRQYTAKDDWLKQEGDAWRMGITDYAQGKMGEIVNLEFVKKPGDSFKKGDILAYIESAKATEEIRAPFDGMMDKTNMGVFASNMDFQGQFNAKPYDEWLFVVKASGPVELMSPADYKTLLATKH